MLTLQTRMKKAMYINMVFLQFFIHCNKMYDKSDSMLQQLEKLLITNKRK